MRLSGSAIRLSAVAAVLIVVLAGCQSGPSIEDLKRRHEPRRDSAKAIRLNREARDAKDDLAKAEKLLLSAIDADPFYGPAHNNLGNVYLKQRKFYQAAWKFQLASKLMPTQSEPYTNLGLVFEHVGRLDDAAKEYEKALDHDDDDLTATTGLARIHVRQGTATHKTVDLLEKLTLRAATEKQRHWARTHLTRIAARVGQQVPTPQEPATTQPAEPAEREDGS